MTVRTDFSKLARDESLPMSERLRALDGASRLYLSQFVDHLDLQRQKKLQLSEGAKP